MRPTIFSLFVHSKGPTTPFSVSRRLRAENWEIGRAADSADSAGNGFLVPLPLPLPLPLPPPPPPPFFSMLEQCSEAESQCHDTKWAV